MESICVVGSNSTLGVFLCKKLQNYFDVIQSNSKNCDLLSNGSIYDFFSTINSLHGLVYCAAVKTEADALQDKNILSNIMQVNLYGAIECLQLAIKKPKIKKIVVIGSADATFGNYRKTMYSVSKAALHQYVKCFAAQVMSCGIEVICLVPGTIKNDNDRNAISDFILSFMKNDIRNINAQLIRIDGGHHTFAL